MECSCELFPLPDPAALRRRNSVKRLSWELVASCGCYLLVFWHGNGNNGNLPNRVHLYMYIYRERDSFTFKTDHVQAAFTNRWFVGHCITLCLQYIIYNSSISIVGGTSTILSETASNLMILNSSPRQRFSKCQGRCQRCWINFCPHASWHFWMRMRLIRMMNGDDDDDDHDDDWWWWLMMMMMMMMCFCLLWL